MTFLDLENAQYQDIKDNLKQSMKKKYRTRLIGFIATWFVLISGVYFDWNTGRLPEPGTVFGILAVFSYWLRYDLLYTQKAQDEKFQELEQRIDELEKDK